MKYRNSCFQLQQPNALLEHDMKATRAWAGSNSKAFEANDQDCSEHKHELQFVSSPLKCRKIEEASSLNQHRVPANAKKAYLSVSTTWWSVIDLIYYSPPALQNVYTHFFCHKTCIRIVYTCGGQIKPLCTAAEGTSPQPLPLPRFQDRPNGRSLLWNAGPWGI